MLSSRLIPAYVLFILSICFSFPVAGQYKETVVQKPGLVRLNTTIETEAYQWFVYHPPGTDFVTTNDGKTCVFAACKSGVTYSVALTAIDFTNKQVTQKIFFVEIGENGPNPPPNPNPPDPNPPNPEPNPPEPTPEPSFPDGKYDLAELTYNLAPKDPLIAHSLANNFQATASSIAAGVLKDINSANADLRSRNQNFFTQNGSTPPEWEAFFKSFASKMNDLFSSNQLKTVQDFRIALTEIEQGLRAIK